MKVLRTAVFAALTGSIVVVSGCGSVFESLFGDGDDAPPPGTTDPNGFGSGDGGAGGEGGKTCTNLCLRQKQCANGRTTSLSGTVMDPAGKVPLYNVLVYVPNAPVEPMTSGASCDRCGSVSGDPLVTAITGVDGKFKLTNVPVGPNIPLVVQIGKWRRQLTIPNVSECTDTPLDTNDIRLPRKKSDGDLPQIALTTGGADVMECWLRKIGIDDEEFTVGSKSGKVHFYAGNTYGGGTVTSSFEGGDDFTSAQDFWSSKATLMKYDIVILSCEGITHPDSKPPVALRAMHDYANEGGRIFASHWHRFWFNTAARTGVDDPEPAGPEPSPFESFATWKDHGDPDDPSYGTITTTFPKGKAMHDWLKNVTALCPVPGLCDAQDQNDKLPIYDTKDNLTSVQTPNKATSWITFPRGGGGTVHEYISFNTPIPAPEDQKCGRVVYSDLHVSSVDEHGPWPDGCNTTDLNPQEKALEFMLFDLSSCVQSDQAEPTPPPVH